MPDPEVIIVPIVFGFPTAAIMLWTWVRHREKMAALKAPADVSSGVETRDAQGKPRRGIKDAARIRAFVQGVRSADGRAFAGA